MVSKKRVQKTNRLVPKVNKLDITFHGVPVVQFKFKRNKPFFTREQIKKEVQKFSDDLKRDGEPVTFQVSLLYPKGWRAGPDEVLNFEGKRERPKFRSPKGFNNPGDEVVLYVDEDYYGEDAQPDPATYPEFRIYVLRNPTTKGGVDLYNDCLYECLRLRVAPWDMPWESPEEFKIFLPVKRTDPVDILFMKRIENALPSKYKITVEGDHTYSSTRKSPHEIKIKLLDGHYSLATEYLIQKGISYVERKPLVVMEGDGFTVFDGTKTWEIDKEEYDGYRLKAPSSPYVLIPCDDNHTLLQTYLQFVQNADLLKEKTNGKINLYKTGTNVKTALDYLYRLNRNIDIEPIDQAESEWLTNCNLGSLVFYEPYDGPAHKYDVVSRYPSIMASKKMLFPIRKGEFIILLDGQLEIDMKKFFSYGIYRCVVKSNTKLFKENPKNYYTHFDLTRARELGLEIKLIEDDKPNFLHYHRDKCLTGSQIFGDYVYTFFPLKAQGIKIAKDLLNILNGVIYKKDVFTIKEEKTNIEAGRTITQIIPLDDEDKVFSISFYKNEVMFESPYARMYPFLISKGRYTMSKMIEPYISHIKRHYCDGFISDEKLPIKTGFGLGDLRYEGEAERCIITSIRVPEGKFII